MASSPKYTFDFSESSFIDVDLFSSGMCESVTPILFRENGIVRKAGTAFCVLATAHNEIMLITARHVIEALERSKSVEPFVVFPNVEDERNLVGVRIAQISVADTYSDVALIVADRSTAPTPIRTPKNLRVTIGQPELGQYTMALGYGRPNEQDQGEHDIKCYLSASRGMVQQIHNPWRDRSLSTFPTFETDAEYPHGMSGGPIINTNGDVVGIVSHSFDGQQLSYGACMGAIVELKVDLTQDDGVKREFTVKELVDAGLLGRGKTALQLRRTPDGVELDWSMQS